MNLLKPNIENKKAFSLNISVFMWGVVMMAFPFRQLAGVRFRFDLIGLSLFLIWVIWNLRFEGVKRLLKIPAFKYLFFFVLWTFLINIGYTAYYFDATFLLNSFLYIGLLMFSVSTFFLLESNFNGFVKITFLSITISLVLQFLAILFFADKTRPLGTFVNPNQLGRFAAFSLVLISAFQYKGLIKNKRQLVFIIGLGVAVALFSMSRAAILATGIVLFINFFVSFKSTILSVGLGVVLFGFGVFSKQTLKVSITSISERFVEENDGDDSIWDRGYRRFLNYPKNILIGAGEARQKRFDKEGYEFHSTYANLLFSYGILGFVLFFLFFKEIFSFSNLLYFLPLFVHSLVHNDIRNLFLWIFFIFILFTTNKNPKPANS